MPVASIRPKAAFTGRSDGGALAELFRQAAQKKTLGFMALGGSGWIAALVRGMLCNGMVTLGALMSLASPSTTGKITLTWLPITTLFALGYEPSIANMYVIPTGMLLGAQVPFAKWWLWNRIPVTFGNIVFSIFVYRTPALRQLLPVSRPSQSRRLIDRPLRLRLPRSATISPWQ